MPHRGPLHQGKDHMAHNRLLSIARMRCPVCQEGPTFRSFLGMYAECPHCGVHFERETGYFLNAMFFAYALGFLVLAPSALYLYFRGASTLWFSVIISVETLLLWPLVFRYARVLWMHADQLMDPRKPQDIPDAPPAVGDGAPPA